MLKKQRSIFVFWICLHICTDALLGQIPKVDDFTIYNHITHQIDRSISGLYQDKYGFMWLSGSENIYRFDGINFVSVLDLKDKNFIFPQIQPGRNHILQDQKERYWFLTPTALVRWDPRLPSHRAWTKYGPDTTDSIQLPTNKMHRIVMDSKGYLWIVFDGQDLYKINPETGKAIQRIDFRINEPGLRRSEIDAMEYNKADNRIYIGADYIRIIAVNPDNGKIEYPHLPLRLMLKKAGIFDVISKESITDFAKDNSDWWLSLTNNIVLRYSIKYGTYKIFKFNAKNNKMQVSRIKKGPDGLLWYSDVNHGLQIIHSGKDHVEPLLEDNKDNTLGNIIDIFFDRKEVMWLATTKGLAKFDQNEHLFKEYKPFTGKQSTIPYIYFQDVLDNEFIGTNQGLLFKAKNDTSFSNIEIKPDQKGRVKNINIINVLFWFKGHYLLGTTNGIYVFFLASREIKRLEIKGDNYTLSQYYENPANTIVLDTIESEPVIWFASRLRYLYQYIPKTKNIQVFLPDEKDPHAYHHQVICNIVRTQNGDIWLSTSGGGLSKMVDKKNVKFNSWQNKISDLNSIQDNSITDLAVTAKGDFWLSTITGIDIYDHKKFLHLDHLPNISRNVSKVMRGNNSDIWTLSANEMIKWSDDGKILKIYPKGKYDFNSMFFKSDGEIILWDSKSDQFTDFSSNKLYVFDSAKKTNDKDLPVTRLIHFEVGKSDYSQMLFQAKNILKHDQNNIFFSFACLSFKLSQSNQFVWKMDGIDDTWNKPTNQNFVSYSNLAPGKYTFRVKSCNADGVWDEKGDVFYFTILPPYYQTWWFLLLAAISAIVMIWYLIHQRTLRLLALQKAELQKSMAIDAERKRIARDMHDDLGSGLSAIHLYSEDLKNSLSSNFPALSSDLDIIVRASWDLNQKVKEIVWSNEIKESTVATLIIFIKKYIDDLICINKFTVEIDENVSAQQIILNHLTHKNIYLSLKEIINNAVKHSNATDIVIKIFKPADLKLIIDVYDNGHGFDLESALLSGGSGLTNIAARVKEIGGDLEIKSDDSGTAIRISL